MRAIIFLPLAAGLLSAQTNPAPLDKIAAAEMTRQKIPGMAVVAVRDDRVIYAQGFGVSSVESKTAVTPDTLFRSGSEKLFFTITAIELAGQGRLRMEAPLGNYMVGLERPEATFTVEQLLSPAATLGDQSDALAGRLIETIRGKPFPAVLSEMVFEPLGMKTATFASTMAMTYPLALGHTADKKVLRPADGAKTLFVSGNEMSRFIMAFLNDGKLGEDILSQQQVLPPSVISALKTPGGIGFDQASGGHLLVRASGAPGYSSAIVLAPEFKTGLIVLTNRTGADALVTARKLLDAMIPVRYPVNP